MPAPAPVRDDTLPIDVPRVAWRALRLRCPNCGSSGFFQSWFHISEECRICGFGPSYGDVGYVLGGLTINLIASEFLAMGIVVAGMWIRWPNPPWNTLLYVGVALAVGLPMLFYPFAMSLFVAINHALRVTDKEPDPRER